MKTQKQCATCPFKIGCDPHADIPGYDEAKHHALRKTIADGPALPLARQHVMACHYSKKGAEIYCAGWIHNQLGVGNNIGVRLAVLHGRMPVPHVEGDQHERFEDTLPKNRRRSSRRPHR